MKITEFIKNELKGWKRAETVGLFCVIVFILVSSFLLKDKPVAVVSAICGILYTIIAGKGKISCYFFGLCGSGCYSLLAFNNAIWGNLILYLFYYIPMQLLGIFKWKKHLNTDTQEIYKTKLEKSFNFLLHFVYRNCSIYFKLFQRQKPYYRCNNGSFFNRRHVFNRKTSNRTMDCVDDCKRIILHYVAGFSLQRRAGLCHPHNVECLFHSCCLFLP